jgi:hypothetical protein
MLLTVLAVRAQLSFRQLTFAFADLARRRQDERRRAGDELDAQHPTALGAHKPFREGIRIAARLATERQAPAATRRDRVNVHHPVGVVHAC